jgi:hypothetical protein
VEGNVSFEGVGVRRAHRLTARMSSEKINTGYVYCGAQFPGAESSRRLNDALWRLIFVGLFIFKLLTSRIFRWHAEYCNTSTRLYLHYTGTYSLFVALLVRHYKGLDPAYFS